MVVVAVTAVILGLMLITAGLVWLAQPASLALRARVLRYDPRHLSSRESLTTPSGRRRGELWRSVAPRVEGAFAQRAFARRIALDLARANLKLTVSEYLGITLGVALSTTLLAALISRSFPVGLIFGLCSLGLPGWYVKGRERRRLAEFNAQLGDTIGIMANSMRAGSSLLQTMEFVSRETPPPMGEEFQRVIMEVGLGMSAETALDNLVRRINSPDLSLMVTAIKIQHEVGGNLPRMLDIISNTIHERVRIRGQITTLTAQQSMAAYILAGLPLLLAGVLLLIDPSYLMGLFTPGWYIAMPICGGLGIVLGFIVMRRIVAIEV